MCTQIGDFHDLNLTGSIGKAAVEQYMLEFDPLSLNPKKHEDLEKDLPAGEETSEQVSSGRVRSS
jgi:hypothetical protein